MRSVANNTVTTDFLIGSIKTGDFRVYKWRKGKIVPTGTDTI